MGCILTIVPVQRVGQPHVQDRDFSRRQQVRRGNSHEYRWQNVHGRQNNRQVYHLTSRILNGEGGKQYKKKIKKLDKGGKNRVRESQKKTEQGAVDAPPQKRKK